MQLPVLMLVCAAAGYDAAAAVPFCCRIKSLSFISPRPPSLGRKARGEGEQAAEGEGEQAAGERAAGEQAAAAGDGGSSSRKRLGLVARKRCSQPASLGLRQLLRADESRVGCNPPVICCKRVPLSRCHRLGMCQGSTSRGVRALVKRVRDDIALDTVAIPAAYMRTRRTLASRPGHWARSWGEPP